MRSGPGPRLAELLLLLRLARCAYLTMALAPFLFPRFDLFTTITFCCHFQYHFNVIVSTKPLGPARVNLCIGCA